jgi:SNF2 family DNA or RNA helicase
MEPITGDITPQRRQEIVDEFAAAPDGAVLASQVQAGGTGLNIQSASVIIFCEPQIKPSIENQAISRAYRMGQVRDVLVYRLLADDTIDEWMLEILQGKQEQFDSFADESVVGEESLKPSEQAWITRMVEEEKKRLLSDNT